jgi:hypothetical protein
MAVDIRQLFIKYIQHIENIEGINYVPKELNNRNWFNKFTAIRGDFSQEELEELWDLIGWDEVKGEYVE